jgi:branched-chain amino acid aminotransferase
VDKIQVAGGRRGPLTEALQRAYFDVINGVVPDRYGWLTYVEPESASRGRAQGTMANAR